MHQVQGSVLPVIYEYQIKITEEKLNPLRMSYSFPGFCSVLNANGNYLQSGFFTVLLKQSFLFQITEKPIKPTFPEQNKE